MIKLRKTITILIAEDDPDDRLLVREALEGVQGVKSLKKIEFVEDGEQLMDYLLKRGQYASFKEKPQPCLIILDLNMPRKDGRQALQEIKNNPSLRKIPIVILTTSHDQEDILVTYDLGVSSYIAKPVSFEDLIKTMETLLKYWAEVVELPSLQQNGGPNGSSSN